MAHLLFIDESGQDRGDSPYEVLAGVSVEDRDLWNLVCALQDAELRLFGRRYSANRGELKGKKLLKRKTFRQAKQLPAIPEPTRSFLAKRCLDQGGQAGKQEITALAQAKLAYVAEVFEICLRFRCRAFASIISRTAPRPTSQNYLRKDYAYLFERFFYYLEDKPVETVGLVVFDELEKSQSHLLVHQMDSYFKRTSKGRHRSSLIVPEPLFVHSDLTTGIQVADLVAYVLSWGFRLREMREPSRQELADFVDGVCRMRYKATREVQGNDNFAIWSFAYIEDLRAVDERFLQ